MTSSPTSTKDTTNKIEQNPTKPILTSENSMPKCRKINTAPSPIISMYCNDKVVHLTCDSGAEATCISLSECKRLDIKISPPSQTAVQIDGATLPVTGEIRTTLVRGPLTLELEALVLPSIDKATILLGSPFFTKHNVDIYYSSRKVLFSKKYAIPWTPANFIESPNATSELVRIARTQVLLADDTIDVPLPASFEPNTTVFITPHSNNLLDTFPPQEIEAVGRTIKIKNESSNPVILKKHEHPFRLRAMKTNIIEQHIPVEKMPPYIPPPDDPSEYLSQIKVIQMQ
jgi:hypothetical protein